MKAIVYTNYGLPDVLQLREVEKPIPGDIEVLVNVKAASLNSWDWDLLRGKPYIVRLWGLLQPKYQIPGADIAGHVVATGNKVTRFQPGDEVFGDLCSCEWGGFAEYACAKEHDLELKSSGMTFEQAAAIPQAGVMALQGIRDHGKVKPGQKVCINGAGGGVGTFAIQMAKSFGAEVTAVDHTNKLEAMRSIGADHVIDYTQEDFTKTGHRYDLILDVVGHHSIFDYQRALSPKGMYRMVGGNGALILQAMLLGPLISMTGKKKLGILAHEPNKDLKYINELFEDGKVIPVIDRSYPLTDVDEAFRYYGKGQVQGKVIITF